LRITARTGATGRAFLLLKIMSEQEKETFKPEPTGGTVDKMGMHGTSGRRRHEPERDHDKDDDRMGNPVNPGATSFAELDEVEVAEEAANMIRKRTNQFNGLIDNIMVDPDVEDKAGAIENLATEFGVMAGAAMERKERWQPLTDAVVNAISPLIDKQTPMKTEGGVKFPKSDFAFTPSDQPSTWKLRLAESPGNVTRSQLGAAAAAFSPGGFRGQKVQIPVGDVAAVKAKIRAAYRKIGVADEDIPPSVRKELEAKNSFMVYKEADGGYRWLAIYSNKFRDRDNPPEIISEASHRRFTKMVNAGELPFPELWLWHVKGSRWGEADFVGYDDNGFAVATGTVDKGKEWVAEALMTNGEEMLTSHGMPPWSIKRDPQDPTVYLEHITKEISPLLARIAANEFTGFSILDSEVKQMAFSDEERAKLSALGVDPDTLEAQTADKAAEAEGLEFKEADKPEAPPQTGDYVSRDEVAALVKSVAESTNQLVQVVGDLAKRIETLEENKLTVDKEILERTPAASLADLYKSVIGSEETKVDGRSALARSGPEETKSEAPVNPNLGGGLASVIAQRNIEIERGGVQ
jgi:hypothetical protein